MVVRTIIKLDQEAFERRWKRILDYMEYVNNRMAAARGGRKPKESIGRPRKCSPETSQQT